MKACLNLKGADYKPPFRFSEKKNKGQENDQ
jgi:hypothetical protein